jgi:uncharacterized protein (TIGR03067 family)
MRRLLCLTLLACPALALAADPPGDKAKLQGVWNSTGDAPLKAKLIVMGDKAGYTVGDPAAAKPVPGSSFVALSEAKFGEEGGKKFFDLLVAKDYKDRVEYRFDKDGLVATVKKKDYPLRRANTRAGDPRAKKFAGTWSITSVETKGQKASGKDAGLEAVAFAGDRYLWKAAGGKEVLNQFYRLGEPKGGKAELDVYGMKGDVAIPALVELKGDGLTIAQPIKPGGARPTGFDAKGGDTFVIHATRAK